jgi:hypothetical protein
MANNTKENKKTVDNETEQKMNEPKKNEKKPVAKKVDLNQYIPVRNGFQGRLIYISKKTGERFVWSDFGDEQEMELLELKNAKNSSKQFFQNNWFMFEDDWVPEYLGVKQYYKNAIPIDGFDDLFEMSPDMIEERVSKLSAGQKRSVAYRARALIAEGGIDSNRAISALENALGIELTEK